MTRRKSAIAPNVAGIAPCVFTILDLIQKFDFEIFSKPVLLTLRRSISELALIDIDCRPRAKIEPAVHGLFLFLVLASSPSGPQASAPVLGRSRFCSDTLASPVHMCLLFPLSDKLSDGPPFNSPTRRCASLPQTPARRARPRRSQPAHHHRICGRAGQRLLMARAVGEGDPHLDDLAVVGCLEGVGGTRRPVDLGVLAQITTGSCSSRCPNRRRQRFQTCLP